jgi:sugar lactone lactonase YvrE/ABC-type Fe3+ transport system permease subunit
MRRSGWLSPILATTIWLAAAAYPIVAMTAQIIDQPSDVVTGFVPARSIGVLFVRTTGYALVVAVLAILLGWAPGRFLGRALHSRGFVPLATLMLLPMCLPAYVLFYTWWQACPSGSAVFDFAHGLDAATVRLSLLWSAVFQHPPPSLLSEFNGIRLLRQGVLVLGLVCWSWPLVAWCVAAPASLIPAEREEMLRLDGAGPLTRLVDRFRRDRRGLLVGGLLVFLTAFNNTTCFDLAQIFSFGNEVRALAELRAPVRQVMVTASPAIAVAAAGAVTIWILLAGRPARPPLRAPRTATATRLGSAGIWVMTVAVPFAILEHNLGGMSAMSRFFDLYGRSVTNSLVLALIAAGLGAVVALGLATAWSDRRPWVRRIAHIQAAVALVPGTIAALALEAAYNVPVALWTGDGQPFTVADAVYRNESILVLGSLARFGFVAALFGRWIAVREPRSLADLRRVDGAETLGGFVRAAGPRLAAAGVASIAVILVLTLSEVPVTARVHPPGSDPLVVLLLDVMHRQRAEPIVMVAMIFLIVALIAALLTTIAFAPIRRQRLGSRLALVALLMLMVTGCGRTSSPEPNTPLDTTLMFGMPGFAPAQFHYPRCIDVDPIRDYIYIIDKAARVQRFDFDGVPQLEWRMPEWENGKPTGISVAPDGRVFIPDTHYQRIIVYDAEGNELMRFGSYGEGPGEFVYPTDVAFGPEGRLYVSEYGGNDRIQVFTAEGEYLFEFGEFGEVVEEPRSDSAGSDGADDSPLLLARPQSIAFNADRTELFIADAGNHRIVVVDPEGRLLRTFGRAGTEPGRMHYPYGLEVLSDGTLMVAEFGNSRLQRFSPDGRSLGLYGRRGEERGELQYPWALSSAGRTIYVLDSGNSRVQAFRSP